MAKSTVGWFGVREKYCSLADKTWLISQIRLSERAEPRMFSKETTGNYWPSVVDLDRAHSCKDQTQCIPVYIVWACVKLGC